MDPARLHRKMPFWQCPKRLCESSDCHSDCSDCSWFFVICCDSPVPDFLWEHGIIRRSRAFWLGDTIQSSHRSSSATLEAWWKIPSAESAVRALSLEEKARPHLKTITVKHSKKRLRQDRKTLTPTCVCKHWYHQCTWKQHSFRLVRRQRCLDYFH